jgi:hypothetical protein
MGRGGGSNRSISNVPDYGVSGVKAQSFISKNRSGALFLSA